MIRIFAIEGESSYTEVHSDSYEPEEGMILMQSAPTSGDQVAFPDGTWAIPFETTKQKAFDLLKSKRLEVEYGGPLLSVDDEMIRFPSEVKDEVRLNSLKDIFEKNPSYVVKDWKVADGVYVDMTATLLQTVKDAGFQHIAATFSVERVKREAIESLETAEEILEWIDTELETGWPA